MNTSSGADVHDVIGRPDGVLVVLDNHQGVTQITKSHQCVQQSVIVPLMQTDTRLIQHIEHTGQACTDLGCKSDSLGLSAGEGHRRTIKTQIIQTDIKQKTKAKTNLTQHQVTDLNLTGVQKRFGSLV